MHGPINVKSPDNISKWQMVFNSAFKGLIQGCVGASDCWFGQTGALNSKQMKEEVTK
jgi:hypothetical protein